MELITPAQNKKLHTLLSHQPGLMEMKREFISNFTNGRTDSAKRLSKKEAADIIDSLEKEDPCKKMVRKIFGICHSLGWISRHNGNADEKKMNSAILDMFLRKRGIKKKNLRDYTCQELPALVTQFELIEKHCRQQENRREYLAELSIILQDLGISTSAQVSNPFNTPLTSTRNVDLEKGVSS